ncbi:MAG: hypothetical protein R2788_11070 [Saprospiraceae bacterium]
MFFSCYDYYEFSKTITQYIYPDGGDWFGSCQLEQYGLQMAITF